MNKFLPAALILLAAGAHAEVTFDWATVGDANNPADHTGHGAVAYSYLISKTEVTVAQYVEFLNAVDPEGTNEHSLYFEFTSFVTFNSEAPSGAKYEIPPDSENRPIADVSWSSAARFVNWLANGQGNGDTESGVYDMSETTPVRNPSATVFLPTLDEWYKAAYYQPTADGGDADGYWLYPVASNTLAGNIIGVADSANFYDEITYTGSLFDVGAYGINSASYYGTFDQGGNVAEWCETLDATNRIYSGGAYDSYIENLESTSADVYSLDPADIYNVYNIGFRVAAKDDSDPFTEWGGDVLAYAIGGAASPGAPSEAPLVDVSGNALRLTVIVRTGDARLTVEGEAVDTLTGTWSTAGVTSTTDGVDQTGLAAGFERRQFSVPLVSGKKFLRLRATLTP